MRLNPYNLHPEKNGVVWLHSVWQLILFMVIRCSSTICDICQLPNYECLFVRNYIAVIFTCRPLRGIFTIMPCIAWLLVFRPKVLLEMSFALLFFKLLTLSNRWCNKLHLPYSNKNLKKFQFTASLFFLWCKASVSLKMAC